MERMWMVRGDSGRLFDEFRDQGIVALGWSELADVARPGMSREELTAIYAERSPEFKLGTIRSGASQVWRYLNEIKTGDRVITYNPSSRRYLVGTVSDGISYDVQPALEGLAFVRKVRWLRELERDQLSVNSKNVLGSTLTLFLVPSFAVAEILHIVLSPLDDPPAENARLEITTTSEPPEETAGLLQDMEVRSIEFIKDKLISLDWAEMQELVAGILRAMGYKTRISPQGSDRGMDIVASPDGLGFQTPRIVVEVKHRTGSMGSKEIRSFLGGRHKDDRGLYVSSGGFSRDSRYEADRASIPLTLWELNDVVRALVDYYDKLDSETRQLVPLKRLYWPA